MTFTFDPDHIAKLETESWRAYYDKEWLRLLYITERVCANEFHIPVPLSLQAAYFATRGAIAFKPVDNDVPLALAAVERYYGLVRRFSGLRFDVREVARVELRYWEVHRRLSGASDHDELVHVFTDLHAATFGLTRERARESGIWRTRAAGTVDEITGHRSKDIAADWIRCEQQLRRCYRALLDEIGASAAPA